MTINEAEYDWTPLEEGLEADVHLEDHVVKAAESSEPGKLLLLMESGHAVRITAKPGDTALTFEHGMMKTAARSGISVSRPDA